MAYNSKVREHSRGSEKAAKDKLIMGLRYAIEGSSEIAVQRSHTGWVALTVQFQRILRMIDPSYDGVIQVTPVSEMKSFETLRKGLRYGIEASAECSVLQDRPHWFAVAIQLEQFMQRVDQLALVGRVGRVH